MPQYELNLQDFWVIVQKKRFIVLSIAVSVFLASIIYTNNLPYVYRATATIRIKEQRTQGSVFSQWITGTLTDPLASYARVVQSQPVLEKVVIELGMINEFTPPEKISEVARSLQRSITTEVIMGTNIIKIEVEYNEPNMAARIANTVAKVFIAENLREKNKQARQVREFIEKQLKDLTVKLDNSENQLKEFREKELPTGIAISLQNRLVNLEGERLELLRQYTDLHPDVVNLNEEIQKTKEQLKQVPESELEFGRLTREVALNAKLYTELKTKLEGARITEAQDVEDVSLVDAALASRVPVSPNKKLNVMGGFAFGILLGLVVALVLEQLDTSIGTIEDVEKLLNLPVLGVVPYLKIEGEQPTLLSKIWPKIYKGEKKVSRVRQQLLIHYSARSAMVEAYKVIRTNIQTEVLKAEGKEKVLLITSSGPAEGKTLTAANLSLTFAQSGYKTLLIDGDLRRASIHKIFGLKKKGIGLTDILRGTASLDDAVRSFADTLMGDIEFDKLLSIPGIDNLNLLTCGSMPTDPAEILAADELNNLFLKFRERYDIVLIDSPPILAVADTLILAPKTDAVIMVYKVGKTASSALLRSKTQLDAVKAACRGIVLNNISPEIETGAAYYYHYKYYGKYYTEDKKKKKKKRNYFFWKKKEEPTTDAKESSEDTETGEDSEEAET